MEEQGNLSIRTAFLTIRPQACDCRIAIGRFLLKSTSNRLLGLSEANLKQDTNSLYRDIPHSRFLKLAPLGPHRIFYWPSMTWPDRKTRSEEHTSELQSRPH